MNEHQTIEECLWNYIDGFCSNEEKISIENLLMQNEEWKQAYNKLLEIQQLVHDNIELEQPSMRFTKNVMEEISKLHIAPATKTYINKKIVYGIAGFFITIIAALLIYSFTQADWSANDTGTLSFRINLKELNVNNYFSSYYINIFLMLNVVLGLVLVDRYFSGKRNSKEHKKV